MFVLQQRRRGALGDELTALQHDDAVGEQHRFQHVVRDHDAGQPERIVHAPVVAAQRVAGERIERAERLVHQHDVRFGSERTRDADALAFAP
jgi:hypothetical protein